MEIEPEIEPGRDSEALLVVLDTCTKSSAVFEELRDAAFRLTRTRLINGISKDDLISVIRSGSSKTVNNLALQTKEADVEKEDAILQEGDDPPQEGGGYEGLEVVVPPITRNLRAVGAVLESTEGPTKSNLLNITDVCGDILSGTASKRARLNRVVIFTDGESILPPDGSQEQNDLTDTCGLYKEHGIQVDIICHCTDDFAHKLQEYEDILDETEDMTPAEILCKCEQFEKRFLMVLAKSTNGVLLPFKEAASLVDRPIAKVKRAVAKFRGVLNIADMIKIPVKRYSFVAEAKPPTAKKVSWGASCNRNEPISVHVETQRVASAKDDSPLQEEEIVNAYPYGPDLVPEATEVDTYAWSIHLPKGLDVIGFVPQDTVPQELLRSHVDVLIAMSDSDASVRLVKSLVLAMQAEHLGILARSVTSAKGGAPTLAYIWPRVEIDRETNRVKNCFLFVTDVPMREDIRELPFAKLKEVLEQTSETSYVAMNKYISSVILDKEERYGYHDDNDESDDGGPLWPPDECNPNLDWFHHCIVHRALSGVSGVDLPPMSAWQRKITSPSQFLGTKHQAVFNEALIDLKNELPIMPVPRREKKNAKLYQALTGDFASIKDYLPEEDIDDEKSKSESEEDNNVSVPMPIQEPDDDIISQLTDLDVTDVSDETPISDFESLVKNGKFRFAAVSLVVVMRRLIRDLADDDKAMKCLQVLRSASIQEKEPRIFNDFISSLVGKCSRPDATGNRTAAFFRYVGRHDKISSTLDAIRVARPTEHSSRRDDDYIDALQEMVSEVRKIASEQPTELSISAITKSSEERI